MITNSITKHPSQVIEYIFDFANDIPSGDSINDYSLEILDSEGVAVTEDIMVSAAIGTDNITVVFQDGLDGQNYYVTVILTLELSVATPTQQLELRVRSQEI